MIGNGILVTGFYMFHMMATIVYCGCVVLIFVANLKLQTPRKITVGLMPKPAQRKQLITTAWLCLAVIGFTGMFQMSANPFYNGILSIHNPWSVAILSKHLLVLVFVEVKAYLTMVQEPNLIRAVFLVEKGKDAQKLTLGQIARSENRMILIMAALFVLILLFTSLARTA